MTFKTVMICNYNVKREFVFNWFILLFSILLKELTLFGGISHAQRKLYFVCWHSIKILFRTDKGRLLACLCVLIRKFHSRLKFLIEHQNFIEIESDRPKRCFTVLTELNRTSQLKLCLPNRTKQNWTHKKHIKKPRAWTLDNKQV